MSKIYVVEDEENIRDLVVYALHANGFDAVGFEKGEGLFKVIKEKIFPNLILLDIMLPDEDGVSILKHLKQNASTSKIPVIMLTAKSGEYHKVQALDTGADDYITKPFSVLELIARVKAVLRRIVLEEINDSICFKGIVLNVQKHTVKSDGQPITLTYKEFELLHYLLQNQGIVLSRDKIMERIWGFDFEGESRTVDMHIKTLRQKLDSYGQLIETVRGIGYKLGE